MTIKNDDALTRSEMVENASSPQHAPTVREGFTPGPWHVGPHYTTDVESREGRVCECTPMGAPRAIANARLIAAAPELLDVAAALNAFQREYQTNTYDTLPGNEFYSGKLMAVVLAARAAIAKAEGR